MTESHWEAWAREIRRRGPLCPDVEALRVWVENPGTGAVPTDPSWRATDAHVKECVRCDLEAEKLRSFFAPAPGEESDRSLVATARIRDLLVRTLAADPLQPASPRVLRTAETPARPLWNRRPWVLALQMALLIGVGLVVIVPILRRDSAPSVPALEPGQGPGQGTLRGDVRPRLLSPRGEQAAAPRRFAWEAPETPPGGWIVRLERVDGSLIWSTVTRAPSIELPGETATLLLPGSRYVWRVRASEGPSSPASAWFEIAPRETP